MGSIPSTQTGQLTHVCNSNSRGSGLLFCPLQPPGIYMQEKCSIHFKFFKQIHFLRLLPSSQSDQGSEMGVIYWVLSTWHGSVCSASLGKRSTVFLCRLPGKEEATVGFHFSILSHVFSPPLLTVSSSQSTYFKSKCQAVSRCRAQD